MAVSDTHGAGIMVTPEMVTMAQLMEEDLGLQPGISLLGVVAAAYLAGSQAHHAEYCTKGQEGPDDCVEA